MEKTKKFNNLAIKASAGTGKTFRLAMRYLSMLILGVEPERILAATFTNKAAGEILKKIVEESQKLAERPDELENAIRKKNIPEGTTQTDVIQALRKLLTCNQKLMISTIDSLFLDILRAFPMECGVLGEISIREDSDIQRMRTLALLRLIKEADAGQRDIIINTLNQATFGAEEKSLIDAMRKTVLNYNDAYLNNQDPAVWGNLKNPYSEYALDNIREVRMICDDIYRILDLVELIPNPEYNPGKSSPEPKNKSLQKFADLRTLLDDLTASAQTYTNGTRNLTKGAKYLCEKFVLGKSLDFEALLRQNKNREVTLSLSSGILKDNIIKLIRHMLALEINFLNRKAKAVYELLKKFNETYTETARKAGALSFSDVPYLIAGNGLEQDHTCFIPEDIPDDSGRLMVLEERLDSRIDHYMLDEFQDTSDLQWRLLKELVGEVFQPQDERERSFFYVGDIKQSIYQWREGNPRLFDRILKQFQEYEEYSITEETLEESYRSSEQVIKCVNDVFLAPEPDTPVEENYEILKAAKDRLDYKEHCSSVYAAKQKGCAMLLELKIDDSGDDIMQKAEQICSILRKIAPFSKNRKKTLSVGILLRSNNLCTSYMEAFREINNRAKKPEDIIPVLLDGDINPVDSMAVSALIQMLRFAYHPSDRFAREYLNMMRFSALAELKGVDSINSIFYPEKEKFSLAENIRSEISTNSLYAFIMHFCDVFSGIREADAVRLNIVANTAMDFSDGDIDFFIEQIQTGKYKSSSGRVRNSVEIMTCHKSKGLDFDIVFLPENNPRDGITSVKLSNNIVVHKNDQDITQNIVFVTAKDLMPAFPDQDEIQKKADNDGCYEELCCLYVAMTRARYALYMFVPEKKSDTVNWKTIRYDTLLRHALNKPAATDPDDGINGNILYLEGEKNWYERLKDPSEEQPEEQPEEEADYRVRTHRKGERIAPSATHKNGNGNWFAEMKGAELGTRVHEIFSKIADIRDFVLEEQDAGISRIVSSAITSEDIRKKLSETGSRLWREKRFLITGEDGEVISGCFDRVVIYDDENGKPVSAEVIDFKTDGNPDTAHYISSYEKQLKLYRKTLSRMLDLPEEKITCTILALCHGKVITI